MAFAHFKLFCKAEVKNWPIVRGELGRVGQLENKSQVMEKKKRQNKQIKVQ